MDWKWATSFGHFSEGKICNNFLDLVYTWDGSTWELTQQWRLEEGWDTPNLHSSPWDLYKWNLSANYQIKHPKGCSKPLYAWLITILSANPRFAPNSACSREQIKRCTLAEGPWLFAGLTLAGPMCTRGDGPMAWDHLVGLNSPVYTYFTFFTFYNNRQIKVGLFSFFRNQVPLQPPSDGCCDWCQRLFCPSSKYCFQSYSTNSWVPEQSLEIDNLKATEGRNNSSFNFTPSNTPLCL